MRRVQLRGGARWRHARRTRVRGVRGHVWAPQTKVRRPDCLARYVARRSRAPYLRRWALIIALAATLRECVVLGADADADEAARESGGASGSERGAERGRRAGWPPATQHRGDHAALDQQLDALGDPGRPQRRRSTRAGAPSSRGLAERFASRLAAATASWIARLIPTPPTGDIACAASPMQSSPVDTNARAGRCER